jgi:phosphoribosylanthranilate isomerase
MASVLNRRTRVKMCGITRLEDAQAAIAAGCDALGFVFYEPSPRYISVEDAKNIVAKLPPFVTTVALFVDAQASFVQQVIDQVKVNVLQFHGDEPPEYCEQFDVSWYKAIRVKADTDLFIEAQTYSGASALLLDTYKAGVPGGTGETFNWDLIPENFPTPVILAGGLEPSNVASAIDKVKPYAVDVSGGIEASKAIKSNDKMIAFMSEVVR